MKNNKAEFESPLPHHLKPVPVAGFIIYGKNSVSSMSKIFNYREPRLVKSSQGWYIKYYYRIPMDVRPLYDNKIWYPFRFTEGMNRRKGVEREEFAEWLLTSIKKMLKEGYNPFKTAKKIITDEMNSIDDPKQINITDALNLFLERWKDKGLEFETYTKYERYVNRLLAWLKQKQIPYIEASGVTQSHIEKFLTETKKQNLLSNREYNNHLDFIRTAFNFLVKKKYIEVSPCDGLEKQKTKSTKHRFYDSKNLEDITRALKAKDPYTYLAFQTVYYLCVRSDKELMNLKIGNINWEQNTILVEVSKTDTEFIPMDENIKELLKNHVKGYPADYFIFGAWGKPAEDPFGRGFFAKRFRKVRDAIGMPGVYTLYGAKHTRVIHLKQDNASDADIMSLTRHKSFLGYAKYLRDLGLDADAAKISRLSRKV